MDTIRLAFEQDLSRFVKYVKAKNRDATETEILGKLNSKEGKGHNTLFNLWNTYEQKLGPAYLEEKLILMGDLLCSLKEYNLSVNQCHMRYLQKFGQMNAPYDFIMTGCSFSDFKRLYFSDNISNEDTVKVLRVLLGISISHSCEILTEDPKIKMIQTSDQLVNCLKVIQFTMQIALEKEEHCWLVYNGTIHIYTICRQMLANAQSKKALEYLLWACVCMESSVPLMTTRYLNWRCQLYTAVCHCYFDINAGAEAEAFAKRGLNLVQELKEIDEMSVSRSGEDVKLAFKEAKLRLQIMIFKRNVYESRRRPKGILRPKNKPLLKDIVHNPWPRTTTERMLYDSFPGRSAQFLAVLEALSDSKRRIAQTSLGAPESDDSVLDVFAELFFAGVELISGGGGTRPPSPGKHESSIGDDLQDKKLIEMAVIGENSINISSIARFVQFAYNYESWDTFESLVQPTISLLRSNQNIDKHLVECKALEVLNAMLPLNMSKLKKKVTLGMDERDNSEVMSTKHSTGRVSSFVDDLLTLVDAIESCLNSEKSKIIVDEMTDILMDACLFVWTKCKSHYSRVTSSSAEAYKHVLQDTHLEKWIRALSVVQRAMIEVRVGDFDPSVCAEASLKLALLIEFVCSENFVVKEFKKDTNEKNTAQSKDKDLLKRERIAKLNAVAAHLNCVATSWSLLSFARRGLQDAIKAVDDSRSLIVSTGTSIADVSLFKDSLCTESSSRPVSLDAAALHMELVYITHRIDCKLAMLDQGKSKGQRKAGKFDNGRKDGPFGMSKSVGKNSLSKAVYLICKAETNQGNSREQSHQFLKDSFELLQKAAKSEAKLIKSNHVPTETKPQSIPPAPRLIFRSANCMVFKPNEFVPENGEKIIWYKLFVRSASGNNVKVRPSDTVFPGTGKEIPNSTDCLLKVSGLTPNERYVIAVAAYNNKGKYIGESVGVTSQPILASSPLPIAIAFGYLAKAAYNAGAWHLAKASFSILWEHFVLDPDFSNNETNVLSARESTDLKLYRMNTDTIKRSSAVLLRYFIQTIFISVDISVKEGALFCDSLCDFKPPYEGQNARLDECRKLLIAINIAGLVNDSSTSLQAVIQCYGLLAPLLQMQIHTKPVLQVFCHCFAVLQELQALIKNRKQSSVSENLQHMVSCIAFYVAKVLEQYHQRFGAVRILESSNRILVGDSATGVPDSAATTNTAFGSVPGLRKVGKRGTHKKMKIGAANKGYKGVAEITGSENIATELKILETYVLKLKKIGDPGKDEEIFELNGTEEPPYVQAFLASLHPTAAYKEVSKFKRRAHFLELFVNVLERALNEGLHPTMMEWTKDAVTWLTRRNEILLNKQSGDQRGGTVVVAVEDERNRQFSTSVVEYGKASKPVNNRDLFPIEESPRPNAKKEDNIEDKNGLKNGHRHSDKKNRSKRPVPLTDAEKKIKDATQKLQDLLPEYYKVAHRRRRLRAVTLEECPWRAQMNLLMAQCSYDMSNDKLKAVIRYYGLNENIEDPNLMEQDWFTLSTCGTLIVSWAGCPVQSESEIEPTIDIGGRSIPYEERDGRSTKLRIDHISAKGKVVLKSRASQMDRHSQKNQQDDALASSQLTEDPFKVYLIHINNTLLYLRRSMVLACRGKNWVLLQNAARELYNISNALHQKVMALTQKNIFRNAKEMPLDLQKLRELLCGPFYVASDSLLEMMTYIYWDCKEQVNKTKSSQSKTTDAKELPFGGSSSDHVGGLSLHFDKILDDTSQTHLLWLKKINWYAVEIMYFQEKWEKLIEIVTRFSALTRDRFAESLLPIVIFAQKQLKNRLNSICGPNKVHPKVVFDKETGIPLQAFFDIPDVVSIEPGAHIDPEGHHLYDPKTDGIKLVSVAMYIDDNLDRLRCSLDSKYYSARALEHSRKLLVLYLAAKQNGSTSKPKLRQGSRVSFIASQIKPQSTTPPDLSQVTFEEREDIECYPLPDNQLAVVISSYDKTIEILKSRQQTSLACQAMHELGNIMFHSGNTRLAFKWWAETLDCILNCKDALKSWKNLLCPLENSIQSSKLLLKTCGIWGCILGGVLATKIARYIHTTDLGMRSELCHLAVALFQGLLCSSLPHPSACIDYSSYKIGLQHHVKELLPGIDIFSDIFRADCGSVLNALLWTANEMIRCGFYLKVLPVLTICQYFTTDVCKDIRKAVKVKLLKVKALAGLQLFAEAIKQMEHVFTCHYLPGLSFNKMKATTTWQQKFGNFNNSKKLTDVGNLKVLRELCAAALTAQQIDAYGLKIARNVEITQSHLLNCIADTINAVPEDIATQRSSVTISVKDESPDVKRTNSKSKKTSPRKKNNKPRTGNTPSPSNTETTPDEFPMTLPRIKGSLLSSSENILKKLLASLGGETSDTDEQILSAEALELSCLCDIELSRIADMRLLPYSAARHIFKAMKTIESVSALTENDDVSDVLQMMIAEKSLKSTETTLLSGKPDVNIDVRLWLECRLKISSYLSGCVKIPLEDSPQEAEAVIRSAAYHIEQGLIEAEALGDSELQSKFTVLQIYRSLYTGEEASDIIQRLQGLVANLSSLPDISHASEILLTDAKILIADLRATAGMVSNQDAKALYTEIISDILKQLMYLGNNILPDELTFQRPLRNIYHDQLENLPAVKLRLGKSKATNPGNVEFILNHWNDVNVCLSDALEVQRIVANESPSVETEIIFIKGLIMRQLFELEKVSLKEAVEALMDPVRLSSRHVQDLSMMRQIYLELSLAYLSFYEKSEGLHLKSEKQRQLEDSEKEKDRTTGSAKSSTNSNASVGKQTQQQQKALQAKRDKEARAREKQRQSIRKAAWVAIRTAGAIAKAQKKLETLTTDAVVVSDEIKEISAPDFSLFEIFRTDSIIRDSDTGMLMNSSGMIIADTRDGNSGSFQFAWLHLVNYLKNLKRLTGYAAMGFGTGSKLCVRTAFNANRTALKLGVIHRFLQDNLIIYDKECCPFLPVEFFLSQTFTFPTYPTVPSITVVADTEDYDVKRAEKVTPSENITEVPLSVSPKEDDAAPQATRESVDSMRTQNSQKIADRSDRIHGRDPLQASELEAAVQWYRSELFDDDATILLFALNNKPITITDKPASFAAFVVVSRLKVKLPNDLRHSLMELFRTAESDLNQPPGMLSKTAVAIQAASTISSTSPTRKKKPVGIKPIVVEQDREEQIRRHLKSVLDILQQVFEKPEIQEVPFDITFKNIACLEKLFNVNFGHLSKTTDAFFAWLSRLLN